MNVSSRLSINNNCTTIFTRLTVGSGFDSNYWNRLDLTIPTLGIESNCQEIENYVIMPRITILKSV